MIRMEEPSYVWNAPDIYYDYKMWWSYAEEPGATLGQLVGSILAANAMSVAQKSGPLRNIIFNCHGVNGGFYVGSMLKGRLITSGDLTPFGIFNKLNIGTIWLSSCQLAKDGTGQRFCQNLANLAGTQVIASDQSQIVGAGEGIKIAFMGQSYIDDFEGTIYSFTPAGGMRRGIDPERDVWTVKV